MNTCAVSMRDRARRAPNGIATAAAVALTVMATWLSPARLPAEEQNLAAGRNGAQVIKYTSEQGGPWRAEKLIDEHSSPGGWASADGSLPQEIVVRLRAPSRFNTVVFNLDSGAPEGEWARDVAVYTADPFPTMGGWKLVANVRLAPEATDQVLAVPAAEGRFIRLLITAAQSADAKRVSLGQFKLFWR